MSQNPESVANQGEFRGKVAPSEPLLSSGHQPGKLVANDKIPTFEAETLPAGSAPTKDTYQPNPDLNNQKLYQDASSTLTGADSSSVHTGLGHPGQGQTSSELHQDKKKGQGLAGLAGSIPDKGGVGHGVEGLKDDPRHAAQRNLDDVPTGQRGNFGGLAAQEMEPARAEQL
ncbi:Nn.00g008270.m01.CDS01 [Neocucurbitaria sp. VM-36]